MPIVRTAYGKWPEADQQQFRITMQTRADGLCESFQRHGLWEFLTDNAVRFFSAHPLDLTQQQIVNASWRMESVMSLMWALGMIPEFLPFDRQAGTDLLGQIPHENISVFVSSARLLDEKTIDGKRSLAELWHWRSRTRELIERGVKPEILGERSLDDVIRTTASVAHDQGDLPNIVDEDFGVTGKAYRDLSDEGWSSIRSIACERHFALNWLCGNAPDNCWDETPTDT